MKLVPWLSLIILTFFTVGLLAQPISTIDTVQNLEITRAQDLAIVNSKRIDALTGMVTDLQGSYNRGVGVGAGIGLTLILMQIFQIVSSASRRSSDGGLKLPGKF